jgi:hypothetical protein
MEGVQIKAENVEPKTQDSSPRNKNIISCYGIDWLVLGFFSRKGGHVWCGGMGCEGDEHIPKIPLVPIHVCLFSYSSDGSR